MIRNEAVLLGLKIGVNPYGIREKTVHSVVFLETISDSTLVSKIWIDF